METKTFSHPFQITLYRKLWISNLVSNIGFWIQTTAAAWLMMSISNDSFWVASVQTASTLPAFLFSIIGGAIADKRKKSTFLKRLQIIRAFLAISLAICVTLNWITPPLLIFFIFALGTVSALNVPAWHSAISFIVPGALFLNAASLNNLSFNLGRGLGGLFSGVFISKLGIGAVFLITAVSTLGLIHQYGEWEKTEEKRSNAPIGNIFQIFASCFDLVRSSNPFQKILFQSSILFFFATSIWTLLPIYTKNHLHLDSIGFGMMNSLIAAGSFIATWIIQKKGKSKAIIGFATIALSIGIVGVSLSPQIGFTCLSLLAVGTGWAITVSYFNAQTQSIFEKEWKARASATYLMVFYASMSLGSMVWGKLMEHFSIPQTFFISGMGLASTFLFFQYRSVKRIEIIKVPA